MTEPQHKNIRITANGGTNQIMAYGPDGRALEWVTDCRVEVFPQLQAHLTFLYPTLDLTLPVDREELGWQLENIRTQQGILADSAAEIERLLAATIPGDNIPVTRP